MIEIPGLMSPQPYVHSKEADGGDYLSTDFYGNRNRHGTVYLSSLNSRLLMDNNMIFYGHHLQTTGMFGKLMDYKNASTFKKAPVIILDGLIGKSVWIIFSAHVSEPEPWYSSPVIGKQLYADYIEELQARSLFTTNIDVSADDRIITLSVCDYTFEDMRFLVHARRLRPGEEIPTEVIAEKNLNQKSYNVSNLFPIRDISLANTAIAQHPTNHRMFYYQMQDGFINRYSGHTTEAQGPFRAMSHFGITSKSFAAAHIRDIIDLEEKERSLYLAVQATGGNIGINLYTAGIAQSILRFEGLVTPYGTDARYPALQGAPNHLVWLLYTVVSDSGSHIYRVLLQDEKAEGEPEFLYTVPDVFDARPLGCFRIDGELYIIWHESENGFIRAARPGSSEIYSINDEIALDARVILYGDQTGSIIKMTVERRGRTSFLTFNLNEINPLSDALTPKDDDDDPTGDDPYDDDPPDGNDDDPPDPTPPDTTTPDDDPPEDTSTED